MTTCPGLLYLCVQVDYQLSIVDYLYMCTLYVYKMNMCDILRKIVARKACQGFFQLDRGSERIK